jgi:integrase/recombinase XerD
MSRLKSQLEEYLALRRRLGYKLYGEGLQLQHFVAFAEHAGATYITRDLALKWATEDAHASRSWWTRRLDMVRGFARYCTAHDPRTFVPPTNLLPRRRSRPSPYLYRDEDIRRLLSAASKLPSVLGLRRHTFETLLGLYAATGLRTNEALHLDCEDVDLRQGVLTIRDTKFGKARVVPVHSSTRGALQRYANIRDRLCPHPLSRSFFLSDRGTRLTSRTVERMFRKLCDEIRLHVPRGSRRPRIHDLRHHLAIATLTRWHRRRMDAERQLPTLSTYLGHVGTQETQWYLTATPALLRAVLLRTAGPRPGAPS